MDHGVPANQFQDLVPRGGQGQYWPSSPGGPCKIEYGNSFSIGPKISQKSNRLSLRSFRSIGSRIAGESGPSLLAGTPAEAVVALGALRSRQALLARFARLAFGSCSYCIQIFIKYNLIKNYFLIRAHLWVQRLPWFHPDPALPARRMGHRDRWARWDPVGRAVPHHRWRLHLRVVQRRLQGD